MLAGMWNFDAGSKSISDLKTGGLIPPYRSLKNQIRNYCNVRACLREMYVFDCNKDQQYCQHSIEMQKFEICGRHRNFRAHKQTNCIIC